MARTGRPAIRHVAAVERALAVLDAVADLEDAGTNAVARRAGVNASTASRLLATLVEGGLVRHVETTGRYRLGVRLVQLGNAASAGLDLRELARPRLLSLAAETGETSTLSVPGDPDAITVDFVQSQASVQSVARLGRPSVAHATATGKVALAFGAVELPSGPLKRYTTATVVDRAMLARELEGVRREGVARALGEREVDLHAVAAPVVDARGELVAVIGVQGPATRFNGAALDRASRSLVGAAAAVARALGAGRRAGAGVE
jgi:DNA-binding IclR family transcriptional regulator